MGRRREEDLSAGPLARGARRGTGGTEMPAGSPRERFRSIASPLRTAAGLVAGLLVLAGCASAPKPAAGPEPAFFPPPPDPPRVQFLFAITSEEDIPGFRRSLAERLAGEAETHILVRPRGVAVRDGVIYVADAKLATVLRIDLDAKRFEPIDHQGPGKLSGPLGISFDEDGVLYVADRGRRQVVAFAPDAEGRLAWSRAYGESETLLPTDVVARNGRLYVTDISDHEIEVYDIASGERVGTLGREGEDPGEFKFPSFIALGPDDTLYVTDTMNFRVQKLTLDGEPLGSYGKAGDWTGSVSRPKGVAVDDDGFVHILDAGFENAQIFLPDGRVGTFYGGYGNYPGHMYLPFEIALDKSLLPRLRDRVSPRLVPKYVILVTNQAGPHKLNVYVFGEPAAGADGGS
ncbi:MAG: SBBP repeat-containing protein [Acidobacteriota bacterium]